MNLMSKCIPYNSASDQTHFVSPVVLRCVSDKIKARHENHRNATQSCVLCRCKNCAWLEASITASNSITRSVQAAQPNFQAKAAS
jgi:hypothetical protein